jgi:hypothetical protein
LHLGQWTRRYSASSSNKGTSCAVPGIVNSNTTAREETAFRFPRQVSPVFSAIFLSSQQIAVIEELDWSSCIVKVPPTGDKLHVGYVLDKLLLLVLGKLVLTHVLYESVS